MNIALSSISDAPEISNSESSEVESLDRLAVNENHKGLGDPWMGQHKARHGTSVMEDDEAMIRPMPAEDQLIDSRID